MTSTPDIEETSAENSLSALGEALENAAETLGNFGGSAGDSAKAAAAKVGSTVSSGVYHGAYGLSYGVVFAAVFLKEFLPRNSSVRRGFEEGAEAAFDAVAVRRSEVAMIEAEEVEDADPKPAKRAVKRVVRSAKTED